MTSIVEFYEENSEPYQCGYCKNEGAFSAGMHAYTMTPEHYQILINRGWRRSGDYVYKMVMNKTCCPSYTIRCEAVNFKLSKSQKHVLKKMYNYIVFGQSSRKESTKLSSESRESNPNYSALDKTRLIKTVQKTLSKDMNQKPSDHKWNNNLITPSSVDHTILLKNNLPTKLTDVYPHPRKAKFSRIKRKVERLKIKFNCGEAEAIKKMICERQQMLEKQKIKSFEKYYDYECNNPAHRLDISFVPVHADNHYKGWEESYQLYKMYQISVHKDEPSECTPKKFKSFLNKNPFPEPRSFQESKNLPRKFGTYHMLYRIDGKLIAVGVLDVLPESISSVYFFYDPEYEFLNLGTYSALREIYFTRLINKISPSIKYYMMGLYIHSCIKMNYKGKFRPSYLLCFRALTWHPYNECLPLIEASKYSPLNLDPEKIDKDGSDISDSNITILIYDFVKQRPDRLINYAQFKSKYGASEKIPFYAKLVGKKLAKEMNLLMVPEYGIV